MQDSYKTSDLHVNMSMNIITPWEIVVRVKSGRPGRKLADG